MGDLAWGDFSSGSEVAPLSVVDQIASHVLNRILSSDLKPGQPISIQELSKTLDVSNIPVREALRRLEGRGLVQFRRGRRPEIAPIYLNDFNDICRLRIVIEGDVARRDSVEFSAERIAQLSQTIAEFEQIILHGSAFDVYSVHSRFHRLMLPQATEWDSRVLDQLWVASERYIQLLFSAGPSPDTEKRVIDAHRRLLDVAATGDVDRVAESVVGHVEFSQHLIAPVVRAANL